MKLDAHFEALTPAKMAAAIDQIVSACQPSAVLVFGSRARGDACADSDLDLLVLLRAPAADTVAVRRRLRALLADLPVAKDILVTDPEHFARWRGELNNVYRSAWEEGAAIWRDGKLDPVAVEEVCCERPMLA